MVLHGHNERGYAMAAVLITLAIMGILMSVAMPVWRHEARREKEAELVFRGEQYARAIALFRYKNASIPNVLPPSIDALVDGKFLRKKYKDPMTEDGEFVLIGMGSQQPGIQPGAGSTTPGFGGNAGGRGGNTGRSNVPTQPQTGQPNQPNMPVAGGMMGVRSKSTETSLRTYRGATRYDQWQFTFNIAPRPGGAMPMATVPDGRGGNPNMPPTFPGANPGAGRNPGQRGRGDSTFPPFNPSGPGGRGPATPPGSGGRGPAGSRGRGM